MKQTENRSETEVKKTKVRRRKPSGEYLRKRYEKRRKKRNRQIFMSRTIALFLFCAALVFVILFMTPLMNVRKIDISGNNVVSIEQINECIGDLKGENLLKVSQKDVESRLKDNAYIKEIYVQKDYFKTTLDITIIERVACGYIEESEGFTVFDDECVILERVSETPEAIPNIKGKTGKNSASELKLTESNIGILKESLKVMRHLELLEKISVFDAADETDIRFTYDDRLEVYCGSDLDLDRKIRLFEAMVNNNNLAENAKGTVDLSVTGNARYSPEIAKTEDEAEVIEEENQVIGKENPNVITGDEEESDNSDSEKKSEKPDKTETEKESDDSKKTNEEDEENSE